MVDGRVVREGNYDYAEKGGAWVLVSAEVKNHRDPATAPAVVSLKIDVASLKVNQPVDPRVFTVDAMGIRKGTHVTNKITNETSLYDDIPIHLKVALQEAQRSLQELPPDLGTGPAVDTRSAASRPAGLPGAGSTRPMAALDTLPSSDNGARVPNAAPHGALLWAIGGCAGLVIVLALCVVQWKKHRKAGQ